MAELKLVTLANLTTFANEIKSKYAKETDLQNLKTKVDGLVEAGGEKNKIDIIKVNGEVQQIASADKSVNIKVPVAVSELLNDQLFQTAAEVMDIVDRQVGSAYKVAGSAAANLFAIAPTQTQVGNVYNASQQFTTNTHFVDGAGKTYPAGTNVVAVDESGTYKWDVLSSFVDLSSYATTESVSTAISSAIDDLDVEQFLTITDMESYVGNRLDNVYEKSDIDNKLKEYAKTETLSSYVQRTELTGTLADYVKDTDISTISESEIKALLA